VCEGDYTYTWTYTDCEGNHRITSYGNDRVCPFPAIAPTSDVVDCYANIVLPAPPVITDNCGVTLTPTGPVETGSVVCEGDYTYTWTIQTAKEYVRITFIRHNRVCTIPAIAPTSDVLTVMQILYYRLLRLLPITAELH
jgi:hypothetical protein